MDSTIAFWLVWIAILVVLSFFARRQKRRRQAQGKKTRDVNWGRALGAGLGALTRDLSNMGSASPEIDVFGKSSRKSQQAEADRRRNESDYRRHRSNAIGDYNAGDRRRGNWEMDQANKAKRRM